MRTCVSPCLQTFKLDTLSKIVYPRQDPTNKLGGLKAKAIKEGSCTDSVTMCCLRVVSMVRNNLRNNHTFSVHGSGRLFAVMDHGGCFCPWCGRIMQLFATCQAGKFLSPTQWMAAAHDMVLAYAANDLWSYAAGLAHIRICTRLTIREEGKACTVRSHAVIYYAFCITGKGPTGNKQLGRTYDTLVRKAWKECAARGMACCAHHFPDSAHAVV